VRVCRAIEMVNVRRSETKMRTSLTYGLVMVTMMMMTVLMYATDTVSAVSGSRFASHIQLRAF